MIDLFRAGVHPDTYKHLTNNEKSQHFLTPRQVFLSLQHKNGAKLKPQVDVGDTVFKGQLVAKGISDMVAPLHSPVNGIVTAIKEFHTAHPAKIKSQTLVIRSNGNPRWGEYYPSENYTNLDADTIIERVKEAGIVGLGGAGFPTAMKLKFARQANVHTVVINGGECEPYLTCDDRLMQENASEIVAGIRLIIQAVGARKAVIGIEDNKSSSIEILKSAVSEEEQISVESVPSIYPMGSERHLIKAVTGQTVPLGKLSTHIGILVHNVATAKAIHDAVHFRRPLISRMITVSGLGIQNPCNVEVLVGTPVSDIIAFCGGMKESTERLVFGGPMMGQIVTSPFIPIDKSVGGILALTDEEVRERAQQDCIRCGQCVRACPMGLMPFKMAAYSRVSDFKTAEEFGVSYCLSCGACNYICPSNIPLVQYFQHAKGALSAMKAKEQKSSTARTLTEARKARLAKEAEMKKAAKANRRKRPTRRAKPQAKSEEA